MEKETLTKEEIEALVEANSDYKFDHKDEKPEKEEVTEKPKKNKEQEEQ